MQKNFQSMHNLKSYLTNPTHCKVDLGGGKIILRTLIGLSNGASMELPTGELQLKKCSDVLYDELKDIIPYLFSEHELPSR